MEHSQAVKIVGASGQISLGKKYAGQTVLIENIEEGVWLLKLAKVIPDNELWMHVEPWSCPISIILFFRTTFWVFRKRMPHESLPLFARSRNYNGLKYIETKVCIGNLSNPKRDQRERVYTPSG
ncbi:MAG: hypothetical protein ACP5SH_25735 [Syntrophobacteraceae bacterium]